ncbi:MAG: ABC transporter permease [Lachnospiraceae bacterium]|nr:ABC transporter permease [Lachnospiraceae bacterium]
MIFRILKRDLLRKKTMNIILLIFVILSTMFASSSTYNMLSVFGGLDYFFEKAGMPDYVAITKNVNGENPADEVMKNVSAGTSYEKEEVVYYTADNLSMGGANYLKFDNPGLIVSDKEVKLNYFNKDNELIESVPEGHVFFSSGVRSLGAEVGDTFELTLEDTTLNLTIDGFMKDALLGAVFIGNPHMLMSEADYRKLSQTDGINNHKGAVYLVNNDDTEVVEKDMSNLTNILFSSATSTFKMAFFLDMIIAALLLIVSICLILIAFTMLSFTIKFTFGEDFREIGVMKAVGIKNRSIRGLYMIKYLFISVIGAFIGYFAGVPFGNYLMSGVTEKIMLGDDRGTSVGIISACAVVIIVLGFCYFCTRRIKKMSPIDAVRSGETGERYKAKSVMKLSKSRLGSNLFLGLNDVLSKPRQYVSMIVTFTVCLLLVMMLANTTNTLMSDKLLYLFGTTKSDAYYADTDKIMKVMGSNDESLLDRTIEDIEKTLADNGMPADVHMEAGYMIPVEFGDKSVPVLMYQCTETETTDYVYAEGLAPIYPDEVAFTPQILEKLGAKIGDKVRLTIGGAEGEYTISASFSSMNQMGEVGRLHQDVKTKCNELSSAFSFQIDFTDNPDAVETEARIERMKEIFGTDRIMDAAGFVDEVTSSSSTIEMAKNMVLLISLIIAVLIAVLMERSFLSKESSEIALMKAIGFKTGSVCAQHTIRFAVVVVISAVIAVALSYPATKLVIDQIFAAMGAGSGITYKIKPLEVFALYPAILTVVVAFAAWLTSLFAKSIKADRMGNIE